MGVEFTGKRNNKTNALRVFYAIPHLICVSALNGFNQALAVIPWVLVLFTSKRNRGLWDLQRGVLDRQVRAYAYVGLTYDTYPNFGFDKKDEPVGFGLEFEESANRQRDESARLARSSIAPRPAVGHAGAGASEREPWDLVRRW